MMGTKNEPSEFDCYANAEPDEPLFVFLARDASAPTLVRQWAQLRRLAVFDGRAPETDIAQAQEAYACADAMEAWRAEHRP